MARPQGRRQVAAAKTAAAKAAGDAYRAPRHRAPSPVVSRPSWGATGDPRNRADTAGTWCDSWIPTMSVGGRRKLVYRTATVVRGGIHTETRSPNVWAGDEIVNGLSDRI